MYEGLQALARLDDATLVRNNTGMLKKVFMSQLQDIMSPAPKMQAAPVPPQMSRPVYRDEGGSLVEGGKVAGNDYVVDAYTVAALGNGSSEAGGEALDAVLPKTNNDDDSFVGMVDAPNGDGMSDNVAYEVERGGDITEARISKDEYIVDENQVKAIGGGDAEKGADRLDKLREEIRQASYGTKEQPNEINAIETLRNIMGKMT